MATQTQLDEAKAEYHALMIGTKAVVYVDQNGERVEYNRISAAKLRQYIAELEAELNNTAAHSGAARGFF